MTTRDQFTEWQKQGYNWVPVIMETLGDLETPLSLYLKLANEPYSYLLESGFNGERWGRYSFIGLACQSRITIKEHYITHIKENVIVDSHFSEKPLDYIETLLNSYKVPTILELPRFYGGFVGYFGYDTIRYIEHRLDHFNHQDPINIPDIYLMLSEQLLVHDNVSNKVYIVVYADPNKDNAYDDAVHKLNAIKQRLKTTTIKLPPKDQQQESCFTSNMTREYYEKGVERARQYFEAGDAMQIILSQRFTKSFESDPIHLYRTLRHINPSPYMYFLNLDDIHIVGASPEILVRVENKQVTVRPLAGTRHRGKTPAEDKQLEQELLSDTKEIAEHLMLIDLGRNDIGRVCKIGSVEVIEQMAIERFSHVMHISSTVVGEIRSDLSLLDVLRATFPAGTVSGAPKVRAMEIIDELEQEKRGLYGGAVGYLGWNGNLDMAIALRTALIKDKQIHIQTGAGLVVDSIPANEWQECLNKGRALFLATELTETNFLELDHDNND